MMLSLVKSLMQFIEFSIHRQTGVTVQLIDLLKIVPDNNLTWSILDFYGIGSAPKGLTMPEFEKATRSIPGGHLFSWPELKAFADQLDQTWDCLIVAVESKNDLVPEELDADNFNRCLIVLRAFDSTNWSVNARDMQLLKKFTKFSNLDQYSGMSNSRGALLQRGPARLLK